LLFFKLLRVYITLNLLRYLLLLSTLFDNYKVIHFVNNKSLFVPGSFIKLKGPEYIKAGLFNLLIISRGTRVLKGLLNRAYKKGIKDLILINIAIIKGFYINIVFKARLLLLSI
jgi:hypothetical protein